MMKVKNTGSGGKNTKRGNYNLSSKIYYQTDGHPQYKNLPKDHPDPEDEEAVAAYRSRRERDKQSRRGSSQNNRPSRNRRNKPYSKRSRHGEDRSRKNTGRDRGSGQDSQGQDVRPKEKPEKTADVSAASVTADPVTDNANQQVQKEAAAPSKPTRRKRVVKDVKRSKEETGTPSETSPETPGAEKPKRKRVKEAAGEKAATRAKKSTPAQRIREEDYTGTALTSDRSAATIISDTLRDAAESPGGNMHTDYQAGSPVSNIDTKE